MRSLLKIMLLCLAFWLPLTASADQPATSPIQLAQSSGKTLNQAVEQVRRQYPNGKIISATTKVSNGREVHHIRVMVNGKVKTVKVNGGSRG